MKALLMCGVVLAMVCAESISSLSQTPGVRYAVCARLNARGFGALKCTKPVPLTDPTQNLDTVCHGMGAEFNSREEALHWMVAHCSR